jgi:hypothetical protein
MITGNTPKIGIKPRLAFLYASADKTFIPN